MNAAPTLLCLVFLTFGNVLFSAAQPSPPSAFAPWEQWKTAVFAGDREGLAKIYSTNPPARSLDSKDRDKSLADELHFWTGLSNHGITNVELKLLSIGIQDKQARIVWRLQAVRQSQRIVCGGAQVWLHSPDGWFLAVSRRSEFSTDPGSRLPQPARPNPSLYPEPGAAEKELSDALKQASSEHKRVLVVFGANWCYDCHVLDTTFRSKAFAPLVDQSYVVVHINIGNEGKDNNDMAAKLGANLDRGIPSLAVLDAKGRVVVAQHNGEFESAAAIGPEDVRGFLTKWKP